MCARDWRNQPIDRIGAIRPPVRPGKNQSGVLPVIDHSVAGLMTAQPSELQRSALRAATYGQQVAFLWVGAVGVFYSPSWQGGKQCNYAKLNYLKLTNFT